MVAELNLPAPLPIAGLPPLRPACWERIAPLLPPQRTRSRPYREHRHMLEGMLWVMTAGTSWRQMPPTFGPRETIYYRFQRWKREGLWEQIRTIPLAADEPSL
ncbi:MAG: transposase [Ktedonobacterales bacterium]